VKKNYWMTLLFTFTFLSVFSSCRMPPPQKTFKSWIELRDQYVVKQRYDYSCGSASLATYLQYYFNDYVTERDIVNDIVQHLSIKERNNRKMRGFSIADLENYAKRRGYMATVVKKIKLSQMVNLKGPVLTLIKREGIYHFIIIRGIREDRIYIADPGCGNMRVAADVFLKQWLGIIMAIGKKGFGLPKKYPLAVQDISPVRNELDMIRFR